MADMHLTEAQSEAGASRNLASAANWLGAGLSLALVVGVGVWGYKLVMRDVSGIPVVRAVEGPMRVAPEDPGGRIARHEGLAVNHVAGTGATTPPPDRLVLAPKPLDLTDEDVPASRITAGATARPPEAVERVALESAAEAPVAEAEDPLQALADRIAADAAPLTRIEDAPGTGVFERGEATASAAQIAPGPKRVSAPPSNAIPASVPGVARSLRPSVRPDGLRQAVLSTPAPVPDGPRELDPAELPKGTRLVQFGAYDSPEVARSEWARLDARFGDYLEGKDRVIEKATSGGRVFYRLRAHGFADLSDSRRFCAAFVAENADCIPVVAR